MQKSGGFFCAKKSGGQPGRVSVRVRTGPALSANYLNTPVTDNNHEYIAENCSARLDESDFIQKRKRLGITYEKSARLQCTRVNIDKITFPLTLTLPCGLSEPPPWKIISDYNMVDE